MASDDLETLVRQWATRTTARLYPDPLGLRVVFDGMQRLLAPEWLGARFRRRVRDTLADGIRRMDALRRSDAFWLPARPRPELGKLADFAGQFADEGDAGMTWLGVVLDLVAGNWPSARWSALARLGELEAGPLIDAASLVLVWDGDNRAEEVAGLLRLGGLGLEARDRLEELREAGEWEMAAWVGMVVRGCPAAFVAEWLHYRDGLVARMARQIEADEDWGALPVLADALEEAGCREIVVLSHLRAAGHHNGPCWVLDMLLGRET